MTRSLSSDSELIHFHRWHANISWIDRCRRSCIFINLFPKPRLIISKVHQTLSTLQNPLSDVAHFFLESQWISIFHSCFEGSRIGRLQASDPSVNEHSDWVGSQCEWAPFVFPQAFSSLGPLGKGGILPQISKSQCTPTNPRQKREQSSSTA